jgi:single-stranded-DNA-specific exonuclease
MNNTSKLAPPQTPPDTLGLHPLAAQILAARLGPDTQKWRAFLHPQDYRPTPPEGLPGLSAAAQFLGPLAKNGGRVLIWGDLDVDGLCAAAILAEALGSLGAEVKTHIPRWHGVQIKDLAALCTDFAPQALLFCDTGTHLGAAAAYAAQESWPMIVLDHHLPKESPPAILAYINPTELPPQHPAQHLSSAALAYLLAQALVGRAEAYLDLAMLGLLADAGQVLGDVRYWMQLGLAKLRSEARPGLLALAHIADLDLSRASYDDLAFQIIPPLNAFGRLGDPNQGLALLQARRADEAARLAQEAQHLNAGRKLNTRQILGAIREQLAVDDSPLDWAALVLYQAGWEAGVLSAVAQQLAQEYQRPVALLSGEEGGILRGSARAPLGYDLMAALGEISDLLLNYGGHPGAAGFSIDFEAWPMLRRRLSKPLLAQQKTLPPPEVLIEGQVPLESLGLALAQDLEALAPFGPGNPRPLLMSPRLKKTRSAKFGREDQHRRLKFKAEGGVEREFLWWNSSHLPPISDYCDLAYEVRPVFRDGAWECQAQLRDYQPLDDPSGREGRPQWIDCRGDFDLAALQIAEPGLVIWQEGVSNAEAVGRGLSQLEEGPALLILTAPPSPKRLDRALEKVNPARVYFRAEIPPFETPKKLTEALSALLRAALASAEMKGEISLSALAERTAHSPETLKIILEGLEKNGWAHLEWLSGVRLRVLESQPPGAIHSRDFYRAFEESTAYRRYLQTADIDKLGD